tara:strand:- start:4228 stop:4428 length:201 start_codon:yes stop_codon:yes gene_type:complete
VSYAYEQILSKTLRNVKGGVAAARRNGSEATPESLPCSVSSNVQHGTLDDLLELKLFDETRDAAMD